MERDEPKRGQKQGIERQKSEAENKRGRWVHSSR